MKKYYLHSGTEQDGPFYISQLKKKGITRETEVWFRGLSDWTCAGQIDELKVLFTELGSQPQSESPPALHSESPPALHSELQPELHSELHSEPQPESPPQLPPIKPKKTEQEIQTDTEPKKNSSKKNLLKLGLITIAIFGVFALFYMFVSNNSKSNPTNYIEKKMTIEEMENTNPKQFLSVDGKYTKNIWGTKFKVKGEITNKASKAEYKDIIIRIKYYSKTESLIESKDYTIYEVFPPNQVKSFKLDVVKYKDVEFIRLNILGAKLN